MKKIKEVEGKVKELLFTALYRLTEFLDGEKGPKLLPYSKAEKLKILCYEYIGVENGGC